MASLTQVGTHGEGPVVPIPDQMNDSWDGARRHPTLTVVRLFVAGFVGAALMSYFGRQPWSLDMSSVCMT